MFWYLVFLINMMIYYLCFLFDMGYCCVDQAVLQLLDSGHLLTVDIYHHTQIITAFPHLCVYLGLQPRV